MRRVWMCALVLGLCSGFIVAEDKKPEKKKPDPEAVFKKKDKNNDGFLSFEEFVGKQANDPEKSEKAKKKFAAKDTNTDSKLSLDEFKAEKVKKVS